tara:strand:+ start:1047 stop:1241 length:195 start_codon:yes stop_codon:yes gene_type:complete
MTGKEVVWFSFVKDPAIKKGKRDFVTKMPASKGTVFTCTYELFWQALTVRFRVEDTDISFRADS